MNKKLTIDFGNCVLAYASIIDGLTKTGNVYSTYTTTINSDLENVIECNGTTIKLDARDVKATELANTNKSRREHLEHQILLAAYKTFGTGSHHVELGTGMPISDILNQKNREEFLQRLKGIGTISGIVEGQQITVTIIPEKVKLFVESHATQSVLSKYFSRAFGNLVIDCGLKTTDVTLFDWDPNKGSYVATKTFSIAQGLETILTPIQNELDRMGVKYKLTYLDRRIREQKYIVRTEQGDYNLYEALMKRQNECIAILTAVKNELGSIEDTNKFMLGGGSELILKITPGILRDNQPLETDVRYKANVLGYLAYM